MKGLVTLAVIGVVIVGVGYWGMSSWVASDPGQMIAFACGNPEGDSVAIQIAVPIALVHLEQPRLEHGVLLWDEWIAKHWIIRSTAGEMVELNRVHFSNLIPEHKVGTPDSYLVGKLHVGTEYQFDYIPRLAEGKRYRHTFTAAPDGLPFARVTFELVEEG